MQLFESKASLFPSSRESKVQICALRQIFCSEPDGCGTVSCESLCSENGKAYRCFLKYFYIYGSACYDLSAQMSPPRQHQRQRKVWGRKGCCSLEAESCSCASTSGFKPVPPTIQSPATAAAAGAERPEQKTLMSPS